MLLKFVQPIPLSQSLRIRKNAKSQVLALSTSDFFTKLRLLLSSRADLVHNCVFRDKRMKIGTWFLDIIRSILRNGATSDLTLVTSRRHSLPYMVLIQNLAVQSHVL